MQRRIGMLVMTGFEQTYLCGVGRGEQDVCEENPEGCKRTS